LTRVLIGNMNGGDDLKHQELDGVLRGAHSRGTAGLQHPPNPPKPKFKKKHRLIDIMISKVLRELSLSRNQPLKSTDD
jgi:hypothetical protein